MSGFAVSEEGAQAGYGGGDDFEGTVDLFGGGEPGEAEAEAGAGFGGCEAHGQEHMGGLCGTGLAGGAEAGGDALYIEGDEEGFGVDAIEAEVGGVGDAGRCCGVEVGVRDGCDEAGFQAVAQSGECSGSGGEQPLVGELGGAA